LGSAFLKAATCAGQILAAFGISLISVLRQIWEHSVTLHGGVSLTVFF